MTFCMKAVSLLDEFEVVNPELDEMFCNFKKYS